MRDQRERGAELNRIMRGETKGGAWRSWRQVLPAFTLGLLFWAVIGWLIWGAL